LKKKGLQKAARMA